MPKSNGSLSISVDNDVPWLATRRVYTVMVTDTTRVPVVRVFGNSQSAHEYAMVLDDLCINYVLSKEYVYSVSSDAHLKDCRDIIARRRQ